MSCDTRVWCVLSLLLVLAVGILVTVLTMDLGFGTDYGYVAELGQLRSCLKERSL